MKRRCDIAQKERDHKIETLVRDILAGNGELISELWVELDQLCGWYCRRLHRQFPATFGLDFDDLYNCGYIALHDALKHFDPDKGGKFSSFYIFYLVGAIYRENHLCHGGHNKDGSRRFDPAIAENTVRLDAEIDSDGKSDTLHNFISSEDVGYSDICSIARVEDRIFAEQLHRIMEMLVSELPEEEQYLIRRKYYDDADCKAIAGEMGISTLRVRQTEERAVAALRIRGEKVDLEEFLDSHINYYSGHSAKRFRESGERAVERFVVKREELEARYNKLVQRSSRENAKP